MIYLFTAGSNVLTDMVLIVPTVWAFTSKSGKTIHCGCDFLPYCISDYIRVSSD